MITQEHQKQGAELMKNLAQEAWENSSFKEQLVNNPKAAIESFTGKSFTMPENKVLVVEDQTDESVIYLNIPAEPKLDELELTEDQLELIAGGTAFSVTVEYACVFWGACIAAGYKVGADYAAAHKQ